MIKAPALLLLQPKTRKRMSLERSHGTGKKVYSLKCATCHHGSGEGEPGKYPPLASSEWVLGSKERIAAIILHGLSGPLTVKGSPYGSDQQMAAWGGDLSDKQIANVMTYIRASWGNTADATTPEEITIAARTKFASQSAALNEADLLKIPAQGADASAKK